MHTEIRIEHPLPLSETLPVVYAIPRLSVVGKHKSTRNSICFYLNEAFKSFGCSSAAF